MDANSEFQKGLFTALSGVVGNVHDTAPQAADGASIADFPYIEIGAIDLQQFDTKTDNGFDVVARIHTRSRSKSMKQAKNIQGDIYDALHNKPQALTVSGFHVILLQRMGSFCEKAQDGSFHGVCEYRSLIEAT